MLSKPILQDIARLTHLKLYQQEKHYIQALVLNSLFSSSTDELAFKGGTALFFGKGLPRFSEDLDFTLVRNLDLTAIADRIHQDLELVGVKNEIRKMEQTKVSWSFKIGAEGPLFNREIERCFVALDISTREKVTQTEPQEIATPYPDVLPFTVLFLGDEEMLAEKVRAILTRNYARDVFDLHFLIGKNVPIQMQLIEQKLRYYQKEFTLKEFIGKINDKKELWEAELSPLIMGSLPPFPQVKKLILEKMKNMGKMKNAAKGLR